jgi:pantothenate kinase type III
MKISDFLQQKLKVSSSVSYYIIAAGGLLGGTVLPGIVGMSYQVFQRSQIDKSEMKMYGEITE